MMSSKDYFFYFIFFCTNHICWHPVHLIVSNSSAISHSDIQYVQNLWTIRHYMWWGWQIIVYKCIKLVYPLAHWISQNTTSGNVKKSDCVIDTGPIHVQNWCPGSVTRHWCVRGPRFNSGLGTTCFDGVSYKWDRLEREDSKKVFKGE